MKFRRILSMVLAACMALGLMAGVTLPVRAETDNGEAGEAVTWTLDNLGTLTISGTGEMTSAPWKTDYSTVIKKVVIEEGVTSICGSAFSNLNSLEDVTIADTVTHMYAYAFQNCPNLQTVRLPANLEYVDGNLVFGDCGIVNLEVPASIDFSEVYYMFHYATIENVYVEDLTQWIEYLPHDTEMTFHNLYLNGELVTDLVIPDGVTVIAERAFKDTTCLESVTIPESVTSIGRYAFFGCTNLKEVNLPESITAINSYTFAGCDSLTSLTLPASVQVINSGAFLYSSWKASALEELIITGDAPLIASDAFTSVTATVYYSANNATWTEEHFQNYGGTLTWLPTQELPGTGNEETVYIIASGICGGNVYWQLDSNGVLTVYAGPAARSTDVSCDMDNYENPEDAPWYAYRDKISAVVVESTVGSVGSNAFTACENLTTVIIEDGVSTIGENAFAECENLTEITFHGSAPEFGENCFENVEATVYYPVDDDTWTEDTMANSGGTISMEAVDFSILMGDVDGNGEVDIFDANLIVACYNGTADLTEEQLAAADVNGDGDVDIFDANLVVSYYNGTVDKLPA